MKKIKVIITGATGMVGEGILFECLENKNVEEVLLLSRKHYELTHPKLKEILISDFTKLDMSLDSKLSGYDACYFCAGISSIGLDENSYRKTTYDTTLSLAKKLSLLNPQMTFTYVSGAGTDSTEKGKIMWARVKGRTENDLMKLPFKGVYNFRPGVMTPFENQKNVKWFLKPIASLAGLMIPRKTLSLKEVGQAMINATLKSGEKRNLEISDIRSLAQSSDV